MEHSYARSWHKANVIKGLGLLICKMPKKHHKTNYGVEKVKARVICSTQLDYKDWWHIA